MPAKVAVEKPTRSLSSAIPATKRHKSRGDDGALPNDSEQTKMIPVSYARQLLPGTF
jgi:hypothetical protein